MAKIKCASEVWNGSEWVRVTYEVDGPDEVADAAHAAEMRATCTPEELAELRAHGFLI